MEKTYFGLPVHDIGQTQAVSHEDIKKLPFYPFWLDSFAGSTFLAHPDGTELIYLHDWKRFCKLFIETGTHRNQKTF